jgi:glycosyltransferase involved in cell wall biosynthesis
LAIDAKYLLALTPSEAAQYMSQGIVSQKIVEVPNGVSLEDFSSIPPSGSFKSSFNICGDVILYLGRVNGRKGIDILVKSFELFSKYHKNAILVIAGPDDGFLSDLKNLVKELSIEEKVVFTGSLNRSEVIAAYNDASVVVYPSIQEGFPIVPLEAGIMGKPLIVSNDPGMDFVRKGKFGLTVEYGNVIQLTNALVSILNNPEKANELGANGKTFVMANYNWNTVGKEIEDTYYDVIENMKPITFEAPKNH